MIEHRKYFESISAARDNVKILKKSAKYEVELCLLGMESQEHIHYAMPIRVMGYDYGSYKKQYEDNAIKYKDIKGLSDDEFISRMRKTDKFVPIITIVVYYGEKPWDGAKSLHGMLNIPDDLKIFINDYKLNLIEARESNLNLHNTNNKDLFNLLEILLNKNGKLSTIKEKAINYSIEHKVEKAVIMAVSSAVNCKLDYDMLEKESDADMCTVFEETRREGEAKGIIELGFEFGLTEDAIIKRLQDKLDITLEKAQEYFAIYLNENNYKS